MPLVTLLALATAATAADIPIGVFKGRQYDGWSSEGTAFRPGPVSGDLLGKLEIEQLRRTGPRWPVARPMAMSKW